MAGKSRSADIHRQLNHPVIDADDGPILRYVASRVRRTSEVYSSTISILTANLTIRQPRGRFTAT